VQSCLGESLPASPMITFPHRSQSIVGAQGTNDKRAIAAAMCRIEYTNLERKVKSKFIHALRAAATVQC
jgi:hypothetical protein